MLARSLNFFHRVKHFVGISLSFKNDGLRARPDLFEEAVIAFVTLGEDLFEVHFFLLFFDSLGTITNLYINCVSRCASVYIFVHLFTLIIYH